MSNVHQVTVGDIFRPYVPLYSELGLKIIPLQRN